MDQRQLRAHLRTLIELDERVEPVISHYFDLSDRSAGDVRRQRRGVSVRAVDASVRRVLLEAFDRVDERVAAGFSGGTRSVAMFARGGEAPLLHVLEFKVPLETRLFVETTPVIHPLVELKDTFDRYVVLIANEQQARILEVSLGSVTREMWAERPELRERVGREWTRQHYLNHRRDRTDRFVKETIEVLERAVRTRGHSHIVLAGSPKTIARVRQALPRALSERVIDTLAHGSLDRTDDVVEATLAAFVEREQEESMAVVDRLRQEVLRGGLGVVGVQASTAALERGQADTLVLASDDDGVPLASREALVRMADATGASIETVQASGFLRSVGGVGCLLRYETPDLPADRLERTA